MNIYCDKTGRQMYYDKERKKTDQYARYVAQKSPEICGDFFDGCEVLHINRDK